MSKTNFEFLDALGQIARDKGISVETLLDALANALVAAYKRMPGCGRGGRRHRRPRVGRDPRLRPGARRGRQRHPGVGRHARRLRPHRRPDRQAGHPPAHPRGRARPQVRGVRRPRGRHRHRHRPADRQPLHAARPGQGRGAAAPGRAGPLRALRARRPAQGLHRRGAQDHQGPPDRGEPHPPGARSSASSSWRSPRSPSGVVEIKAARPRARAPHQDRGVVQRPQRRPGRRLRRRPGVAGAHGHQRAAGRDASTSSPSRDDPVEFDPGRARSRPGSARSASTTTPASPPSSCSDYQLSLAIGKEGQNARLAARLTGWRIDIKSETQLAEEEAGYGEEWAEGEWVENEAGEMVWQPAEGGEAISAEEWYARVASSEARGERREPRWRPPRLRRGGDAEPAEVRRAGDRRAPRCTLDARRGARRRATEGTP